MKITIETLRALGACADWTHRFEVAFPDGIGPDADPDAVATAYPFPVAWAFDAFQDTPGIASAWAAYQEASSSARAAYEEATASAQAAYEAAIAPAWAAYEEPRAPAWAAFEAATAPAWAAYREVRVPAEHTARVAVVRAVLAHLANGGEIGGAA